MKLPDFQILITEFLYNFQLWSWATFWTQETQERYTSQHESNRNSCLKQPVTNKYVMFPRHTPGLFLVQVSQKFDTPSLSDMSFQLSLWNFTNLKKTNLKIVTDKISLQNSPTNH